MTDILVIPVSDLALYQKSQPFFFWFQLGIVVEVSSHNEIQKLIMTGDHGTWLEAIGEDPYVYSYLMPYGILRQAYIPFMDSAKALLFKLTWGGK